MNSLVTLIFTIVIGFIVGAIAKLLMPGPDRGGFWITAAIGIGGAMLANYVGAAASLYRFGEPAGFIASVLGAMALLALYRLVRGNRSLHT